MGGNFSRTLIDFGVRHLLEMLGSSYLDEEK